MFVKEIAIDGFKSYSSRTVVSGFDASFNAITGLNGSGKSNILDAIVFVLGISNLSQVRVNALQELVYKQGQAGITKASVTVTFDNSDPESSPIGYEDVKEINVTRQVTVSGKSKYMINGRNASLQNVQNLFHSVQLNVNNPHFLIMQGRITKVLNMKPPEILSMIEEAAGTRMFEMKKASALKTIEKKDAKLREIDDLLSTEIKPRLDKLRAEMQEYQVWEANQNELAKLTRFVAAYDYVQSEERKKNSSRDATTLQEKTVTLRESIETVASELGKLKAEIEKLTQEKAAKAGGEIKEVEQRVATISKELVKQTAAWNHKKETLESERKNLKSLEASIHEVESELKSSADRENGLRKETEGLEKDHTALELTLSNAEKQLQAIRAGVAAGGDSDKSLTEQLIEAKEKAASSATEAKNCDVRVAGLRKEIAERKKTLSTADKEFERMQAEYTKLLASVQRLEAASGSLRVDAAEEEKLVKELKAHEATLDALQRKYDQSASKVGNLELEYSDPEPGFDRSKVKGYIAGLLELKDPSKSTALEIAAGGRLWQVVVDSAETGAKLISPAARLRKRITVIPLDKIQPHPIPDATLQAAQRKVGRENVHVAISFVGYDRQLERAMEYVFGSTFIVSDAQVAAAVAFDKNISVKCVTLEGDTYDPAGTLSGGSLPNKSSVLQSIQELNDLQRKIVAERRAIDAIRARLSELQAASAQQRKMSNDLELARHEASLLETRLRQSKQHEDMEELRRMEAEVEQQIQKKAESEKLARESKEACVRIERDMKDFASQRDKQTKETEANIKRVKEQVKNSQKALHQKQQQLEAFILQLGENRGEVKALHDQKAAAQVNIQKYMEDVDKSEENVAAKKAEYDDAAGSLAELKEALTACDKELTRLSRDRSKLDKSKTEYELDLKKSETQLAKMKQQQKDGDNIISNLLKQHPWIKEQKQFFGQPNTEFDFSANGRNPQDAIRRLRGIEEAQGTLAKIVNKKINNMFAKAQQDYEDLVKKQKTVTQDKDKIREVIADLDEKKKEALRVTWEKVNRDFGSIFQTLLPGTAARLEPPEGQTVLDGLEVRVAFGGVWKESLTELSGGQRSLLALSLILALLLFKPAPMYILDEVDAALDLSHTQNIGRMLKRHFTKSQFIVVSLKEGMFQNANVVFRTKVTNGQSSVLRTVNSPEED